MAGGSGCPLLGDCDLNSVALTRHMMKRGVIILWPDFAKDEGMHGKFFVYVLKTEMNERTI